jgi:hypothetical protein
MYAQVEKAKENKSRAVANYVVQKRRHVKQDYRFVDNRPEAVAQRKLQEMADDNSIQQQQPIQKTSAVPIQLLSCQQMANNGPASQAALPIQKMSFYRFTGLGALKFYSSYTDQENELLKLYSDNEELIGSLKKYREDLEFGEELTELDQTFSRYENRVLKKDEYSNAIDELKDVFYSCDKISTKIAVRDIKRLEGLDHALGNTLTVVSDEEEATKPDQVTQEKYDEIRDTLSRIATGDRSNLVIAPLMPNQTFNLAQRSAELSRPIPGTLLVLEKELDKISQKKEAMIKQYDGELDAVIKKKNKALFREVDDTDKQAVAEKKRDIENATAEISRIKRLRDKPDPNEPIFRKKYKAEVGELLFQNTMMDLLEISKTGVGRDLLNQLAVKSLQKNQRQITIRTYENYVAPTAGQPSSGVGGPYVNYTPQTFKDRDTEQRSTPKAPLNQFEELAKTNKWQENKRSDITLFHELVHTKHMQEDSHLGDDMVQDKDLADQVDKGIVREEEYYTVGLGKYADEKFTENAYRKERSALGEDVAPRSHYTHKDKTGKAVRGLLDDKL